MINNLNRKQWRVLYGIHKGVEFLGPLDNSMGCSYVVDNIEYLQANKDYKQHDIISKKGVNIIIT
jgi:hypothetical protein